MLRMLIFCFMLFVGGCNYLTPPLKSVSGPKTEVSRNEHATRTIRISIKTPVSTPPKEIEDE